MSMPGEDGSVSAQLLLKISGDVSGLVTDVAVIKEQTRAISDHETRIRALERFRWGLPASALAAIGSGVAAWLAYVHH